MDRKERLRNADFLQMAAHELDNGRDDTAVEAIYDVVKALHNTEFDREANTLLGAAMHSRFGRTERAQRFIGEVFDRLTQDGALMGMKRKV